MFIFQRSFINQDEFEPLKFFLMKYPDVRANQSV